MAKILDPVLLEEMIQYNESGNFDRIIAAELAIGLAMKLDPLIGKVGAKEDVRTASLFRKNKKIFSSQSQGDFLRERKINFFIMAIIRYTKDSTAQYAYLNVFLISLKLRGKRKMTVG
ncbi:MAG: hypothetical protein CM15mV19_1760 [uncultured marine virus]|nr:MAG: hypothetical protein CM15mV19_1760 [uncultured marine virus]